MQEDTLEKLSEQSPYDYSAVLIANPTAGSYTHLSHRLNETVKILQREGWKAELELTTSPDSARELTREAVARGADAVIAVGGDGTINEIIQELAGSQTALGVLPSGTVNVWAREVGIPLDHVGARNVLLKGQTRSIDLGAVNGRYFLLMASVGLDGEVAHAVEKKRFKRLGVLGYLLVAAWLGLGYPAFRARVRINGRTMRTRALQITVGNTQLYGGTVKFTWRAKIDDGLLDMCLVRSRGILGRLVVITDFLFRRRQRRQWVNYETCPTVQIHTRHPIGIQIDGDAAGYTPATFTIAPAALRVIIPEKTPPGLFSDITKV